MTVQAFKGELLNFQQGISEEREILNIMLKVRYDFCIIKYLPDYF